MLALLLAIAGAWGCASPRVADGGAVAGASQLDPQQQALVHGYSLLYDLVSRNRGVQKILMIKTVTKETSGIIRDIAGFCEETTQTLERMAAEESWLAIDQIGLPGIERLARDAEEKDTTKALLFGKDFERDLLLSQAKATGYARALALSLAEVDEDEQRRKWLAGVAERFHALNGQIEARLVAKP